MSKKITIASILCLVLGGVSIPGGMFVNNFIVDLTYSSMDQGLLGIQEEAVPLITQLVKEYGVAETLSKILEIADPFVQEIVKSTFSAYIMKVVFEGIQIQTEAGGYDTDVYGYPASLWQYFNDQTYQFNIDATVHGPLGINIGVDVLEFQGISNYFGSDLGFTTKARNLLALGQEIQQSGMDGQDGGTPFDDTTKVLGCPNVTQINLRTGSLVDAVGFSLSNGVSFSHGGTGGGSRILDLLPGEYIKKAQLKTGAKVDRIKFTTSKGRVFEHGGDGGDWRFEKVAPDGWQIIGFHGRSGTEVDKLGFIYAPLVTDPDNWVPPANGLIVDTASGSGVTKFLEMYENAISDPNANTAMRQMYDCTWDQLEKVKTYIINYLQNEMIPIIIEGVDVHVYALGGIVNQWEHVDILAELMPKLAGSQSVAEIAEKIFAELWSEGTAIGNVIFEGGLDFGEILDGIPLGATGFEAGLDVNGNLRPLGFSTSDVYALWDENNEKAIANMKGIAVWHSAKDSVADKNTLKSEFSLSDVQIDALLDWLWSPGRFSDHLLPILLESDYGYGLPMKEFCVQLLLEQWANGTVFGEIMFPDPGFALPLGDVEIYGFEAGIPTPTGMTMASALSIWDENNDYSLVSGTGVKKWMKAVEGDVIMIEELRLENDLDDHALDILLDWIPSFQHDVMPFLAKYQYGLPMDTISLAGLLQLCITIFGGTCIGLAILGLTSNIIVKKRSQVSKMKKTFPSQSNYLSAPTPPRNDSSIKTMTPAPKQYSASHSALSSSRNTIPRKRAISSQKFYQTKQPHLIQRNLQPTPRKPTPTKKYSESIQSHSTQQNYRNDLQSTPETSTPTPKVKYISQFKSISPANRTQVNSRNYSNQSFNKYSTSYQGNSSHSRAVFNPQKRQCPKCGARGSDIKELHDKTRIISYAPIKTYAIKKICKKCRLEF